MTPSLVPVPTDDLEVLLEMASRFLLCAAQQIAPARPDDMQERAVVIHRCRLLLEAR